MASQAGQDSLSSCKFHTGVFAVVSQHPFWKPHQFWCVSNPMILRVLFPPSIRFFNGTAFCSFVKRHPQHYTYDQSQFLIGLNGNWTGMSLCCWRDSFQRFTASKGTNLLFNSDVPSVCGVYPDDSVNRNGNLCLLGCGARFAWRVFEVWGLPFSIFIWAPELALN